MIPRREHAVFTFGRAGMPVLRRNCNDCLGSFPGITAPQQQWPVYLDQPTSGEMHVHAWDCG
jgi:hypothetical protein